MIWLSNPSVIYEQSVFKIILNVPLQLTNIHLHWFFVMLDIMPVFLYWIELIKWFMQMSKCQNYYNVNTKVYL